MGREEAEGCQSGQRQVMHCMGEMTHIMFMIHSSIINFSRTSELQLCAKHGVRIPVRVGGRWERVEEHKENIISAFKKLLLQLKRKTRIHTKIARFYVHKLRMKGVCKLRQRWNSKWITLDRGSETTGDCLPERQSWSCGVIRISRN